MTTLFANVLPAFVTIPPTYRHPDEAPSTLGVSERQEQRTQYKSYRQDFSNTYDKRHSLLHVLLHNVNTNDNGNIKGQTQFFTHLRKWTVVFDYNALNEWWAVIVLSSMKLEQIISSYLFSHALTSKLYITPALVTSWRKSFPYIKRYVSLTKYVHHKTINYLSERISLYKTIYWKNYI